MRKCPQCGHEGTMVNPVRCGQCGAFVHPNTMLKDALTSLPGKTAHMSALAFEAIIQSALGLPDWKSSSAIKKQAATFDITEKMIEEEVALRLANPDAERDQPAAMWKALMEKAKAMQESPSAAGGDSTLSQPWTKEQLIAKAANLEPNIPPIMRQKILQEIARYAITDPDWKAVEGMTSYMTALSISDHEVQEQILQTRMQPPD